MGDGEWLLWDDTYYHEVWNDSEDVRIAHFLDIWRPHMPPDMWIMSKDIGHHPGGDRLQGVGGKISEIGSCCCRPKTHPCSIGQRANANRA
jgi:hypothetical protein